MKKVIVYLTAEKTITIECESFNVGTSLELRFYKNGDELVGVFFTYVGFTES